ncbi:MAG TPA: haloacid dehalogenase type II [Stellaceae bacterium]|nr:haloacid dehalogenase type II [Stellaceae bacterium]
MRVRRRDLLTMAASGAALSLVADARSGRAADKPSIKAVAFDAFPVFDPRPLDALAEAMFPGRGAALVALWRTRQFEYGWLRTLTNSYVDFWRCTEDALSFAAKSLRLDLDGEKRRRLMNGYLALKAWPDAAPALHALKAAGLRLAFLSNFTAAMLDAAVTNSGLDGLFEAHLTTDRVRAFKPDPRAYRMGVDAFGLAREEIAFCAFAGWDAAGAKSFGYPTFWINRTGAPIEELGVVPDAIGRSLADLVAFTRG